MDGTFVYDAIQSYITDRSVSATEAHWRILGFKMHHETVSVIDLPVHQEDQQTVHISDDDDLREAAKKTTGGCKVVPLKPLTRLEESRC